MKPNILVIFGDDIGMWNLSCYSDGMMGYRTPNIDRLAKEGMKFTDAYGEQSCTAGRASFITGQSCFRTGLSKVGVPAATVGLKAEDPTIAELLKNEGYATGQFGKNHLGDRNEYLPTVHGFDEFYGNLYHLNAEEEPEMADYPSEKDFPEFRKKFGPRGVLRCKASEKDDLTETNAGAGSASRLSKIQAPSPRSAWKPAMTTSSLPQRTSSQRQVSADKPFFCWVNTTHMHLFTHTKPESLGQAGRWQSPYTTRSSTTIRISVSYSIMLDTLRISDNTLVLYTTDNGPHMNTWPDGAMTPFRSEKNTNWEGAFRIPLLVRWPGKIAANSVSNEIVQHHDWPPTSGDVGASRTSSKS